MNNKALNTLSDSSSDVMQEYFPAWHPLKSDWLEGLTVEIKEITQYAQQCLADNQRTDKQVANAITQIKKWWLTHPDIAVDKNAPKIVVDENLGNQLELAMFVNFLLAQASAAVLRPYEFAALALLREAAGLADLDAVAKKDALSTSAQYLTLKIARLHWTIVLLRMLDENPQQHTTIRAILTSLFQAETA